MNRYRRSLLRSAKLIRPWAATLLVRVTIRAPGQREVPEVVGSEVCLEPVGGAPPGTARDPGIVDQDVDPAMALNDAVGEPADRGEVGEVEDLDGRTGPASGAGHLPRRLAAPVVVSAGQHDMGSVRGQPPGGLQADAAAGTSHHSRAIREVADIVPGPSPAVIHGASLRSRDARPGAPAGF
jgi:hypothetical protein